MQESTSVLGGHAVQEYSLLSKRHPLNLNIRAVGVLLLFPPLLGREAWTAFIDGKTDRALLWGGIMVVGVLLALLHLVARWRMSRAS